MPTAYMDSVRIAQAVGEAKESIDKPLFTCFMAGRLVEGRIEELKRYRIPNYKTGERCAKVIHQIVLQAQKNR